MSEIAVILPDGSELGVPAGATLEDVAYEIGPGLGKDTVAGKIEGELVDKATPVSDGDRIEIVTDQSDEYLSVLRHSAAHVFAQALLRLYDDAKLTIGPWTDEGFYYDITGVDLDEDDIREIEDEMAEIVDEDYDIERVIYDREEAIAKYEGENEYKLDILEDEAADSEEISFYKQAEFEDLCRGPHVESTGKIGAFKLLNISSSYWRGDEENDTLTRVHGTAFEKESQLDDFLDMREEAKERDHRKLGAELDLFSIPEVTGPGLPLYHPNGKTILRELEQERRQMGSYE